MDESGAMKRLFKYPPVEDVLLFVEQALNLQQNSGVSPFAINNPHDKSSTKHVFPANLHHHMHRKPSSSVPEKKQETQERNRGHSTSDHNILDRIISVVSPNFQSSPSAQQHNHPNNGSNNQVAQQKNAQQNTNEVVRQHSNSNSSSHNNPSSVSSSSSSSTTEQKRKSQIPSSSLEDQISKLKLTQTHMSSRLERIIYSLQRELLDKNEASKPEEERMDSIMVALAELKQVKDVLSGLLPAESFFFEEPQPLSKSSSNSEEEMATNTLLLKPPHPDLAVKRRSSDPFGITMFSVDEEEEEEEENKNQ